jgi:hypothetical protein
MGKPLHFEVFQQRIAVHGLFVLAILMDEPDAIQTVLTTVITDPKSPPNVFAPKRGVSVCFHEPQPRAWRNNFGYRSHSAFYGFSYVAQQWRNVDQVVRNVCALTASDQFDEVEIIAQLTNSEVARLHGNIVHLWVRTIPIEVLSAFDSDVFDFKIFQQMVEYRIHGGFQDSQIAFTFGHDSPPAKVYGPNLGSANYQANCDA